MTVATQAALAIAIDSLAHKLGQLVWITTPKPNPCMHLHQGKSYEFHG